MPLILNIQGGRLEQILELRCASLDDVFLGLLGEVLPDLFFQGGVHVLHEEVPQYLVPQNVPLLNNRELIGGGIRVLVLQIVSFQHLEYLVLLQVVAVVLPREPELDDDVALLLLL